MSDKELIEKMNKKLNPYSSVKKIPVKIINKKSNEKDDKELIDKLNKTEFLVDIPEVKVEEKEDCCGNCCDCGCDCEFKEDNEPCDKTCCCDHTCSYDKLKDELNDAYKKFEKSQWQEEFQKIIDKTPYKTFLGCSSRFLCTPLGQMFIDALATNPTYKWNDIIDKRKEFDSSLSFKNDISNVKNEIDTIYNYNVKNEIDTEEIISNIINEIEKRIEKRNKKANEVWCFIKDNVESMKDYMHKYDNQIVTINELNTLFEKYVDMWNLLKERI